jgi:Protein of unknown function (DUF3168)
MSAPTHPIAALKAALRGRLLADANITALIGTAIYDAPPRGVTPPYLVLGDADARESGTTERDGLRVELELVTLTAERGTSGALGIASAVAAALAAPLPTSDGQRLIVLGLRQMSTRYDPTSGLARITQRLGAFTEPL